MSDTVFVTMYNPNLGNVQVDAPLQAVSTYASHGWLLLDPQATPPPVASPYLSQPAADSRYLRDWAGAEVLTAGAVRVAPDGHIIVRAADGTTRSTYDTTEQALWTTVGGGSASDSSVAALIPGPSATATALRAALVPKWKPSTAYASGEFVLNPSGQIVSANTAFTSAASYSSSNWTIVGTASLPTQTGNGGKFLTTDGTAASWGTPAGGSGSTLTPTGTKTAAYTAAVGDLAMMNVAGGATVLTLPTAPADKAQVGYRAIGATAAVPLVVNRGGSTDKIGTGTATSASVTLADETIVLQYDAANTRWLGIAEVAPKSSLDKAYMALSSGVVMMPPPSGDTTGATDTANFQAALASLPSVTLYQTPSTKGGTSATFRQGTIVLQAAPADVWWDQVNSNITGTPYYFGTSGVSTGDVGNIGPLVSVIGPGHNTCVIRYLGTGNCLRAYNTLFPSSDTFDTLSAYGGKFDGFTIDGSLAGAGAVGLHAGDSEGFTVGDDFWVCNFVGGSIATPGTASKGIFWDNAVSWTENIRARANLYNNTIGVYFGVTTGDLSFMYSSHEYKIYAWPNQFGVCLDGGANFDQGSLVIRGNFKNSASANAGACLAFNDSPGGAHPNNRIADSHLSIQAEVNSGLSGGSNRPYTIYFATAYYSITKCYGILNFGNTWTASNYNVAFPLNFNGLIGGDATLQSSQAFNVAGVAVSGTAANGKVLTATSASAATWQAAAVGGAYYPWSAQGLLGWSFDEAATGSSGIAPASQQLVMARVPVPSNITITNVVANVTAAGATLTAGAQNVGVVYDSSGNLLGQTADQATNWTSTGAKIMPLVTPVAVTGGSGVYVWVGVLAAGTTIPSFSRSVGTNNSGLTAPNFRFSRTSSTALTSPPAGPVSLGSTSTSSFWFGVS